MYNNNSYTPMNIECLVWGVLDILHFFSSRFDFFGIYVVMFLEILRTLIQVLCVFSILIIAFGLAFFMLLGKEVIFAYV